MPKRQGRTANAPKRANLLRPFAIHSITFYGIIQNNDFFRAAGCKRRAAQAKQERNMHMETDVRKILQSLADTAANAADEAKAAVHSASKAMLGRYDNVKMNVELSRVRTQQERLFADLGRMLFLIKTGAVKADEANPASADGKTPQQAIDALLLDAERLQGEMENIAAQLAAAQDEVVCPACGHRCTHEDTFCSVCGKKL